MLEYLELFMEKTDFPEEARKELNAIEKRIESREEDESRAKLLSKKFLNHEYELVSNILDEVNELGAKLDISQYTMQLLFYIRSSITLREMYKEKGITEEIFWNTMYDFHCKLMECWECHGVWGGATNAWPAGFFGVKRFGLGRLQYEDSEFYCDTYSKAGITVSKGDFVINIHIPSSGPLTEEKRMDSYRRAYNFYKNRFYCKPVIITCNSWLMYPKHEEFLPKTSNILSFMHDFDIIRSEEHDGFPEAWRVFGRNANKAPKELPRDTSLRRAYAERMEAGKKMGSGYGIMLFDGEKIVK